ncbi:hypothetical protein P9578_21505 [Brevibacillus choshinensis]|uniref:hypothetical protein n=1 Tax=Brevibacillus choshinensis TaxID=54911 RepID=UPI002E1D1D2F|nr:hypothetical protein [Brevibacillus choshinensis]
MGISAIEKRIRGIVLTVCLVVLVLGGFFYWCSWREPVKPAPFLTQPSLEQVSFDDQWQTFRQQAGITEEAMLEEFHLIHDEKQNTVSVRMRIIDQVDGQFYSYLYTRCYSCPVEEQKGKDVLTKREGVYKTPVPRLTSADDFFRKLDIGMKDQVIVRNEFPYYLIVSSGEYASIGLPGTYYRVKETGLERMSFPDKPKVDGFYIQLIGSETPGPFSSSEKSIQLIFS